LLQYLYDTINKKTLVHRPSGKKTRDNQIKITDIDFVHRMSSTNIPAPGV